MNEMPSWFKIYGTLEKQVIVAWSGSKALWKVTTTSTLELYETLGKFVDVARTWHRAQDSEQVPDVPEYSDKDIPNPIPPSGSNILRGLSVFIEAGHGWTGSNFDPGAVGFVQEWTQNVEQATAASKALEAIGANVRLELYQKGTPFRSLRQRGAIASGNHIFVSCHNNASSSTAQGTETLVDRRATTSDISLGKEIQQNIVKATGFTDRVFTRGGVHRKNGVIFQGLGVLRGAAPVTTACCLTESYFVTGSNLPSNLTAFNAQIGQAIAKGIEIYARNNRSVLGW
jgi:N-acetylmuramoyl-L-alanine amidase